MAAAAGRYKDAQGNANDEYWSLFADQEKVAAGRSPVEVYRDYMQAFNDALQGYMGSTVVEVMVGLGPSGELRYPAYQTPEWQFCGIGEFQCSDNHALDQLSSAASAAGHPEWGHGGPDNAGQYRTQPPSAAPFFGDGSDNYQSGYGRFFLGWYAQALLDHGDRVLGEARSIWPTGQGVTISGKVAGVHWWYKTPSHAAEVTAGYYNTNSHNAYDGRIVTLSLRPHGCCAPLPRYAALAGMFARHSAVMDFTALEMQDNEQPAKCDCGPFELVDQAKEAAASAGTGAWVIVVWKLLHAAPRWPGHASQQASSTPP